MTKAKKKSTGTKRTPKKKETTVHAAVAEAAGGMSSETGHIDQIRDIIFGNQMSDYEERFKSIEANFNAQIDGLRQEMNRQTKALETQAQKHFDALMDRIDKGRTDWGNESKDLSGTISKMEASLTEAIDALSSQQSSDMQSMEERLKDLSAELSDEIHIKEVEASKNLENAVASLDTDKLNRLAFSEMLRDMAARISDGTD